MTDLLPLRGVFLAGDPVSVEVIGSTGAAAAVVSHLGDEVLRVPVSRDGVVELGVLPPGGYGVELIGPRGLLARTALDVQRTDRARLRYGFTVDFGATGDPEALARTVRRLHLTGIQFYDWAYRHADLLGGGEIYQDALGQPVSLDAVRASVTAVQSAGARALGYAAVYAVGPEEWGRWRHDALLQADGEPFALGDFLFIVDPAAPDWLAHFCDELSAAVGAVGFDGFHLDQYGYPKVATRADGVVVDVAESFATLVTAVRGSLPDATLVFNNVNDFPTWYSAGLFQDAVYVEPWEPNATLSALARISDRARALGNGKPVVLAAYQHVYDQATVEEADRATSLSMATLFSHGATQLLAGEADRILVDPYYVRNHAVGDSTADLLRRWYDFAVEHDELLLDPAIVDVTGAYAAAYNDDVEVTYEGTLVSAEAVPGTVWRRVTRCGDLLVVHAINLTGQTAVEWDAPAPPFGAPGTGALRLRALHGRRPRVRVADPDRMARLTDVPVRMDGTHALADLPEPAIWQIIVIDLDPTDPA